MPGRADTFVISGLRRKRAQVDVPRRRSILSNLTRLHFHGIYRVSAGVKVVHWAAARM
jgi:hypothetical protein